nr:DNA topoisomerase [Terricaulis sp.]
LRNAQEAHEAIRPTSPRRTPEEMARFLEPDQARLYELIWKRTMACQMEAAEFERTTVEIPAADGSVALRATGSVQMFDGFLKLYQEGRDDEPGDEDATRLPRLAAGDALKTIDVKPEQHFTEPPPRYSEATLVKRMEELGIGRPSTYASILSVLRDRNYVRMDRGRFVPEDKGRIVTTFLENFFRRYVEYDFTAALEDELDQVSSGALKWKDLLRNFWKDFIAAIEAAGELRITQVIDVLDDVLQPHLFPPREDGSDPRLCPTCKSGKIGLRLGRFGAFLGCSNYPECNFTRPLTASGEGGAAGPRKLGEDPATGLALEVKVGRFGPYIERAPAPGDEKPKRASIPKGWSVAELTLEQALQLINLPREIGLHPETGEKIVANFGRFGPYVSHQGAYANLDSPEEVFSVGINRAVTLLAEKAQRGGGRVQRAAPLREVGKHPADGKPVALMKGKYGVYVNHGKTNATLPKDADPEKLTLDEALALIAAKGGAKAKAPKVKSAKAKPEAAAKKPAAKKTATPKKPARKAAPKTAKAAE